MKYFVILYFIFFSNLIFSEEKKKDFDLIFKPHYQVTFEQKQKDSEKYLSPFNQDLNLRAGLYAKISDQSEVKVELNPTADLSSYDSCYGIPYVNEVRLSYRFTPFFSLDFGCLKALRGAHELQEDYGFQLYDTADLSKVLYDFIPSPHYTPATNLKLDLFGTLSFQIAKNMANNSQTLPNLNLGWRHKIWIFSPIIEAGFYDKSFKSFHYSASLGIDFKDFHIDGGYFEDHKNEEGSEKKLLSNWHVKASYKHSEYLHPVARIGEVNKKVGELIDQKALLFSFGNEFTVYEIIHPYISFNYKNQIQEDFFNFRLGVYASL